MFLMFWLERSIRSRNCELFRSTLRLLLFSSVDWLCLFFIERRLPAWYSWMWNRCTSFCIMCIHWARYCFKIKSCYSILAGHCITSYMLTGTTSWDSGKCSWKAIQESGWYFAPDIWPRVCQIGSVSSSHLVRSLS